MQGDTTIDVWVDGALDVTAVDVAVGSVADNGWLVAARSGEQSWSVPFNSVRYQASLVDAGNDPDVQAGTLADMWVTVQARVTLMDGRVLFTRPDRLVTNNRPEPITDLGWQERNRWAADYTDLNAYVRSYTDMHTSGRRGSAYGKELGATTIVPDPAPRADRTHGNVAFYNVPKDYAARTAATRNTFTRGTYGPVGDQPPTGGLRCQYAAPPVFGPGDIVFYGFSILLPTDFPTPTKSHVSTFQFMGPPFNWGIAFMLDAYSNKPTEHRDAGRDMWQYWGNRLNPLDPKLLEIPFDRGTWQDYVIGFGCHTDPRQGWVEIHTARPGVNDGRLTQHVFPDGTTRLRAATIPQGSQGLHTLQSHVYRSRDAWPGEPITTNPVRAWFAKQATGGSAAEVDPHSYA